MDPIVQDQPALEIDGLTVRYGRTVAVADLHMTIPPGGSFGFLGPNGAGKSTTLRSLMGLLRREAGRVRVLGVDPLIDPIEVRQRVGYVPEQQFIHRWMKVGEAIHFCRRFFRTWNDRLSDRLLKFFDLDPNKKVSALSKGNVTKLALLLAMAHDPEVLILDEPMAGLDPVMREELLEGIVQTVCERQVTLLFSSHTLADVQRMASTIGIIHEGKLRVLSEADELLRRTRRIRAVLSNGAKPVGVPDSVIWQRVENREWLMTVSEFSNDMVQQLRQANHLENVEVMEIGLEEIFKDYVRGWRASA